MIRLPTRLGPLDERPFRLLWLGRTTSALGDALIPVALAFAVIEELDGSAGDLGLVFASFSLSRVLLTLTGGVWADRLQRRAVMLACVPGRRPQSLPDAAPAGRLHGRPRRGVEGGTGADVALSMPDRLRAQQPGRRDVLRPQAGRVRGRAGRGVALGPRSRDRRGRRSRGWDHALRWRPQRPLLASVVVWSATVLPLAALADPQPALVVGLASACSFLSVALGNTIWEALLQEQIPSDVLARVSSYDWLVSLVFQPLGFALAGPVAATIGTGTTLRAAAALSLGVHAGLLLLPDVWRLRRVEPDAVSLA